MPSIFCLNDICRCWLTVWSFLILDMCVGAGRQMPSRAQREKMWKEIFMSSRKTDEREPQQWASFFSAHSKAKCVQSNSFLPTKTMMTSGSNKNVRQRVCNSFERKKNVLWSCWPWRHRQIPFILNSAAALKWVRGKFSYTFSTRTGDTRCLAKKTLTIFVHTTALACLCSRIAPIGVRKWYCKKGYVSRRRWDSNFLNWLAISRFSWLSWSSRLIVFSLWHSTTICKLRSRYI